MTTSAFEQARLKVGTLDISALLATAGGFLDAFTWVGHGHVFSNAMTGNLVLLGINCLSGSWRTGIPHLAAILAFLAGVCVAQAMELRSKHRDIRPPYTSVLLLEIGFLLILSLLPATNADILFTTAIAFAASVQVQTFRQLDGHSYNSTFITGNLRKLAEAAMSWFAEGHSHDNAVVVRDFFIICSAFLAGAIAGAYAFQQSGNRALWYDVILLILVAIRVQFLLASRSTAPGDAGSLETSMLKISASK